MHLLGIHHLTAVSAQIRENHRFYTQTLGMRLVKRSVNQDDVSAYHLFYADAKGTPGSDLTFFDWNVPREQRGTRSITRTALRVGGLETLAWWHDHLTRAGELGDDRRSVRRSIAGPLPYARAGRRIERRQRALAVPADVHDEQPPVENRRLRGRVGGPGSGR